MKIRLLPLAVAILMLAYVVEVHAQDADANPLGPGEAGTKIFLGPCLGYNSVSHSTAKLATFAGDRYCPSFEGGTGQGFYVGLTYEHHLGKKKEESTSSIIGRLIYSMYPGSMKQVGDKFPSLIPVDDAIDPSGVSITDSETEHTVDITYNVLSLEVMFKQNLSLDVPLGFTAGPTFEYPIQKQVLQEYNILSPPDVKFAKVDKYDYKNNDRTVIVKDGDIDNASPIRIGIKFGLQYEIIIGEGYYIVPAVFYNWSLLNVKTDETYRINAFQVGVDIRFAL
ncbi:MAG: hypothetical protein V1779_15655 [bacterium]